MDTIGLFQLENLTISRSPHIFLDVRVRFDQDVPPSIERLLNSAAKVAPDQIQQHLQTFPHDKSLPILLLSEDEKGALKVGRTLESAGYVNVYTIAGGVLGLLSEL